MGNVDFKNNLFNWDDENGILNSMQLYVDDRFLLVNDNAFEKHILENIKNHRLFTQNNGHDCPPPDYYSDSLDCMFDVLRINATEETDDVTGKTWNPAKIAERKSIEFFKDVGFYGNPYMHLITEVHGGKPTYEKYSTQAKRVIANHIQKIPVWKQEHPKIMTKGLIICDVSPLCIEVFKADTSYHYGPGFRVHEVWNDFVFSSPIYKSDLDFVVWFSPWKWGGSKFINDYNDYYGTKIGFNPAITIVDTKNIK